MTLPKDVNKLVAVACGFEWDLYPLDIKKITVDEWVNGIDPFEPDKDDAAAMFAVKAYAMLTGWDIHINVLGESNSIFDGLFEVCVDEQTAHYDDDFCQAVCAMILEAEKVRTK